MDVYLTDEILRPVKEMLEGIAERLTKKANDLADSGRSAANISEANAIVKQGDEMGETAGDAGKTANTNAKNVSETDLHDKTKVDMPEADNAAEYEKYKDSMRAQMEKPYVQDSELSNIMDELYRDGATVGSGSTADAVRHELATGQPVGGKWHTQKAQDKIKELNKWLKLYCSPC